MDANLDLPETGSLLMQTLLEPCNKKLVTPIKPASPPTSSSATGNTSSTSSKVVSEDRPWVCEKCGFPFKYKNNLLEHMRFYHMKGSVSCNKCSQVFATSTHLRLHRKDHSMEQGKCPHCRYNFPGCSNDPEKYRELYLKHLPECRRCPAKISSKIENKCQLNDTDTDSFDWSCLKCCKRFTDPIDYGTHECLRNKETEFPLDIQTFASTHLQDFACQNLPYSEADIHYELPVDSSDSANIDFNFLCIICGVNFENEEKLNLHLYECHQTCDHEAGKSNLITATSKPNNEVGDVSLACQYCYKDFPDKCALENHEENCKPDISEEGTQGIHKVVENMQEDITEVTAQDAKSEMDSAVPFVCRDDEGKIESRNLTEFCDSLCATVTDVPESSSPVLNVSFTCKICKALFLDFKELELHRVKCKLTLADSSAEVIVQWLCKYCKVAFANKTEMRAHKEVCSLEYQTSKPNNVLIRWVCKYCKEHFDTRDSMCTHKKSCSLMNKDKSVVSSTESDVSEIASREGSSSKRRYSLADNANSDTNQDVANIGVTGTSQEQILSVNFTPVFESGEFALHNGTGVTVLEYNIRNSANEPKIEKDLNEQNRVKDESVLFAFSDQEESVLVKWVCKYCKEDFEDRDSMRFHKISCKLRCKGDALLQSGGSDDTRILMNKTSSVLNKTGNSKLVQSTTNACKGKVKAKPQFCEICSKKFDGRVAVKAHKLECHMFKCSRCGRYFETNSKLWKHSRICRLQKISPNNQRKLVFTCKRCYRVFRERYRYNLHKLSCLHEMAKDTKVEENVHITIPGQEIILRIQCAKCTGSYVGYEIFNLHTCEDPRALEVFMDCTCGMTTFPNIATFYSHCLKCSSSSLKNAKTKSLSSTPEINIVCFVCRRQFNDVFLYYLHLVTNRFCRITNGELNLTLQPLHETGDIISEEEINDWTCSFCQFIVSSSVPKSMHYKMCKTKVCHSCGFYSSNSKKLSKHNCNKGLKYMASAKVLLERIPSGLVTKDKSKRPSESTDQVPEPIIRQPRVQRCVMCYKKCKLEGVGLPPIGQLECFNCRNKMHRKELKKRGETFFSRSLFDSEETQPSSQFQEEITYLSTYLDPSKRLKISRALTKAKNDSQDTSDTQVKRDQQHYKLLLPSNSILSTSKIVEKCSHCKRSFSSKGQLEKHVKLSKTCMHAETNKEITIEPDLNQSSIINFVDFLTNGKRSLSLEHNEGDTPSDEQETLSSYSNTQNNNSCNSISSLQNDNSNSNHESSNTSDVLENDNTILCRILSGTFASSPSQTGRSSYLVLKNVEKVMKSYKQLRRVPISPVLQCDGWILKSGQRSDTDGSMKSKFICGACFKSFSTEHVFLDHVSTIHELSGNTGVKLHVMKHIPNEMLNKLSW